MNNYWKDILVLPGTLRTFQFIGVLGNLALALQQYVVMLDLS
jgi:hypothetical protein